MCVVYIFTLSTHAVDKTKLSCNTHTGYSHRRSTKVSLETYPLSYIDAKVFGLYGVRNVIAPKGQ